MPICEDRRLHHAGEAGERRAEAEHQRVKKLRPDGTYWVTNCTPAPPG
jgi:hypothetical protein